MDWFSWVVGRGIRDEAYIPCSISFLLSSLIARILFIVAGSKGFRLWSRVERIWKGGSGVNFGALNSCQTPGRVQLLRVCDGARRNFLVGRWLQMDITARYYLEVTSA